MVDRIKEVLGEEKFKKVVEVSNETGDHRRILVHHSEKWSRADDMIVCRVIDAAKQEASSEQEIKALDKARSHFE